MHPTLCLPRPAPDQYPTPIETCLPGPALGGGWRRRGNEGNPSNTRKPRTFHHLIRESRSLRSLHSKQESTGVRRTQAGRLPLHTPQRIPWSHFAQSEGGHIIWALY